MTKEFDGLHYHDCHMTWLQFTNQAQNEDHIWGHPLSTYLLDGPFDILGSKCTPNVLQREHEFRPDT